MFTLPTKCYHQLLEEYFDNPLREDNQPNTACNESDDGMCSFCTSRYSHQFPKIKKTKEAVIDCLNMHAFNNGPCIPRKLNESLNKDIEKIFTKGKEMNNEQSEGLVLQMLAIGLITFFFDIKGDKKQDQVLAKWSLVRFPKTAMKRRYIRLLT